MEFKYSTIDVENATSEEISNEIIRLSKLRDYYNSLQLAYKIFLNSIYGAFGNEFFLFYDKDLAESITLQGRHFAFTYTRDIINDYFLNDWHNDHELHKKLGVSDVKKVSKKSCVYGDTDSLYIYLGQMKDSCGYSGSIDDFVLDIYNYKFKDYLKEVFEEYSKEYNVENIQNFELEKISDIAIFMRKKRYITSDIWKEPGIKYKPGDKVVYKGLEMVRSTTPKFIRKKLKDSIGIIVEKGENLNQMEFMNIIKQWKDEYKLEDLENISMSSGMTDYEKFVLNDRSELVLEKHCPIHVRAAGIYNYLINQNSKYKQKYGLIKSKDKVSYYYSINKHKKGDVFGFPVGSYPMEINPPKFDYDVMFAKNLIIPLNKTLKLVYGWEIPENLISYPELF